MSYPGHIEPEYRPEDNDVLFHDSTTCALAVEDHGIGGLLQSADRDNDLETALAVYSKLYPAVNLAGHLFPTLSN